MALRRDHVGSPHGWIASGGRLASALACCPRSPRTSPSRSPAVLVTDSESSLAVFRLLLAALRLSTVDVRLALFSPLINIWSTLLPSSSHRSTMSYSRVKIAARLRPAIPGEQHDKAIRVIRTDSGAAICVDNPRDPSQTFKYPSVSPCHHSMLASLTYSKLLLVL